MASATLVFNSSTSSYCSNCGLGVNAYENNITDHENINEANGQPQGGCFAVWNGWATKDNTITTVPQPELWSALTEIPLASVVWGPGVS